MDHRSDAAGRADPLHHHAAGYQPDDLPTDHLCATPALSLPPSHFFGRVLPRRLATSHEPESTAKKRRQQCQEPRAPPTSDCSDLNGCCCRGCADCTESFIDVDLRFTPGNASTKALLAPLKKTVLWLVHNQVTLSRPSETKPTLWPRTHVMSVPCAQSADGHWGYVPSGASTSELGAGLGFSASGDAQRSPRALSLLQWYYQRMEPLPEVEFAINRYVDYLRKCTAPFGLSGLSSLKKSLSAAAQSIRSTGMCTASTGWRCRRASSALPSRTSSSPGAPSAPWIARVDLGPHPLSK